MAEFNREEERFTHEYHGNPHYSRNAQYSRARRGVLYAVAGLTAMFSELVIRQAVEEGTWVAPLRSLEAGVSAAARCPYLSLESTNVSAGEWR
jgi:hypothetical protein